LLLSTIGPPDAPSPTFAHRAQGTLKIRACTWATGLTPKTETHFTGA